MPWTYLGDLDHNGTGRDGRERRNAPKVGWCWWGNRHTWLVSPPPRAEGTRFHREDGSFRAAEDRRRGACRRQTGGSPGSGGGGGRPRPG
ncbi:DUF5701 family protein [Streptomyces sp. NPDC127106]|uniref:DUF5701 family protein n=1 Tax=Streptomyces sp. NPDC127106 TaxID=3345360 RepID=UPI00363E27B4